MRRMGEIDRIMWEDLDEHRQAVKVQDMKNPGQKIGNDVWCHLPDEAWRLCKACRVSALRSSLTTPTQSKRSMNPTFKALT
ncbi:hypothetical protein PPUJ20066_19300 [Pseudomonas putida]|nr:hypothetical protein PPUJ20066_19300 [Pseudomonas putida]